MSEAAARSVSSLQAAGSRFYKKTARPRRPAGFVNVDSCGDGRYFAKATSLPSCAAGAGLVERAGVVGAAAATTSFLLRRRMRRAGAVRPKEAYSGESPSGSCPVRPRWRGGVCGVVRLLHRAPPGPLFGDPDACPPGSGRRAGQRATSGRGQRSRPVLCSRALCAGRSRWPTASRRSRVRRWSSGFGRPIRLLSRPLPSPALPPGRASASQLASDLPPRYRARCRSGTYRARVR